METSQLGLRQAAAISRAVDRVAPIDILVRTPDRGAFPSPRGIIPRIILADGRIVDDARG